MDKEQRRRMAYREFIGTDPEQSEISYMVQVSGSRVEIHRQWPDDDESAPVDTGHECWVMSVDDLKKLVECATWAIQKSAAFEEAHPAS